VNVRAEGGHTRRIRWATSVRTRTYWSVTLWLRLRYEVKLMRWPRSMGRRLRLGLSERIASDNCIFIQLKCCRLLLCLVLICTLNAINLHFLFLPNTKFILSALHTLSVKMSGFTVWRHNWRKNWVNCAVFTGNSAGYRTVFSSRLSHRTAQFNQGIPQFPQFTCWHHDGIIQGIHF
jgi:hypothetical protein